MMKNLTIYLPDQFVDTIDNTLVKLGYFPNRSEAIRYIIKFFLKHEFKNQKELDHIQSIFIDLEQIRGEIFAYCNG